MLRLTMAVVLAQVLVLTLLPTAMAAPTVIVDGKTLVLDVPPVVEKGRVLVPLRGVLEALETTVEYDEAIKTVVAARGDVLITLRVEDRVAYSNNKRLLLDVPPKISGGLTMIPLRFISESLGARVDWDNASQTAHITSSDTGSDLLLGSGRKDAAGPFIERTFTWEHRDKKWSWNINIRQGHYEYFKNAPRPGTRDYSIYVTNRLDDYYMSALVKKLWEAAGREGLTDYEPAALAVSFVQNLAYVDDDVTTGYDEYPRYPLETLVDRGGDCEDTSILLASILHEMGYDVVLLALLDHMAVGVAVQENLPGSYWEYEGARYYYVETTGAGWQIGELPREYKNTRARILPLVPRPVVSHAWQGRGTPHGYEIKVTVKNDGTATAPNTIVYAAFDAGNGKVYNQSVSEPRDIGEQEQVHYTIRLEYPFNVRTRVLVKIISDGILVDESRSDWLNT